MALEALYLTNNKIETSVEELLIKLKTKYPMNSRIIGLTARGEADDMQLKALANLLVE